MSAEKTRAIATQIMHELDRRNLDGILNLCAPDARFHGFAPETLDANGYREAMGALLEAFSDSRFLMDDIIVEEEKASIRHSMRGTHLNPFQGIPASGKSVIVNAVAILHLTDGAISEVWLSADFMGLMQQIGAIPAPELN